MASFRKFHYAELVAINSDNTILAGHQRCHIMLELGWGDRQIEVRVPTKKLNKRDADEYLLRSNKNVGEWDDDILANNFDADLLHDAGFTNEELGMGEEDDDFIDGIDPEEKLAIEITCDNEEEQRKLYEEFEGRGLKCKLLTI